MARRRKSGWTSERLSELIDDFKKMHPGQICKKYGFSYDTVVAIHEYALISKRLETSSDIVTETVDGKAMTFRLTKYSPGFATGAHRTHD